MSLTFILATTSTTCIVISAILIAFGWKAVRSGDEDKHKKLMVTAAAFAITFFIIYESRTLFLGNVSYSGPESLSLVYHLFLFFHIILATVGGVMGIISLYLGFKQKFTKHAKIGPYTSVIWFLTAITGVVVYLVLFVLWPGDADSSLLKAIFGA